jgi:hypothetical protein
MRKGKSRESRVSFRRRLSFTAKEDKMRVLVRIRSSRCYHQTTYYFPEAISFVGMCLFNTTGVNLSAVRINLLKTKTTPGK